MLYCTISVVSEETQLLGVQDSAFSSNQNLQNLLIITAVKSDPTRVADYIHRLDGFEPKAVAQVRCPLSLSATNLLYLKYRSFCRRNCNVACY